MNQKYLKALLGAVALIQISAIGCGKKTEADSSTASAGPVQEKATGGPKIEKGGSAADTKAYPAPSGTQSGNFAGGMK